MGKVKQKVSGCFRQQPYVAYCRISSSLQTMARKGTNPPVAIQLALAGEISASAGEQLRPELDWPLKRGRYPSPALKERSFSRKAYD
jgi:hypothetical protein